MDKLAFLNELKKINTFGMTIDEILDINNTIYELELELEVN